MAEEVELPEIVWEKIRRARLYKTFELLETDCESLTEEQYKKIFEELTKPITDEEQVSMVLNGLNNIDTVSYNNLKIQRSDITKIPTSSIISISELDLTNCINLEELGEENPFAVTKLMISGCKKLKSTKGCDSSALMHLEANHTALESLSYPNLRSANVEHCKALKKIDCSSLIGLNISHSPQAEIINLSSHIYFLKLDGYTKPISINTDNHQHLLHLSAKGCTDITLSGSSAPNLEYLDLSGCISLTTLPESLSRLKTLDLSGCTSLTSLPKRLDKLKFLNLSGCNAFTTFPEVSDNLESLNLSGCTWVTSLPEGLSKLETLDLSGCTSLTSLPEPERLDKLKFLNLSGCNAFTTFPEVSDNLESLNLSGCTWVTSLPEGLSKLETLDLSGCTSLTSLPETLGKLKGLNLSGCTGLTSLSERLDKLDLSECTDLNLSGCTWVTSLPKRLDKLETLDLSGTMISKLPSFLKINITQDETGASEYSFSENFPPRLELVNLDNCENISDNMKRLFESVLRISPSKLIKLADLDLTDESDKRKFIEGITEQSNSKPDPIELFDGSKPIPNRLLKIPEPNPKATDDIKSKERGQITKRIPRR